MRAPSFRSLPLLLISCLLPLQLAQAATETNSAEPQATATVNPQIVRLSYVEGDVRISRGKAADKLHDTESGETTGWEKAETNIALASGYSLVTGTGHAEIELEDASIIYLGDNSVLSFGELSSTAGVPYTEMELVSGTAILNVQTMAKGELLNVSSPTDRFTIRYPDKAYVRVDSFLDAMAITPQQALAFHLANLASFDTARPLNSGQTFTFRNGRRIMTPASADVPADADFDQWVAKRVAARAATMSAVMKDAGLSNPIPGLAEMSGQGKFFACEPYGTCWQPAKGWDGKTEEVAAVEAPPAIPVAQRAVKSAPISPVATYMANHPGATLTTEDYTFPCSTYGLVELIGKDPVTGKETVIETRFSGDQFAPGGFYQAGYPLGGAYPAGHPHRILSPFVGFDGYWGTEPWSYGVCHAGYWVRWHHRYAWVAGEKRHHKPPVRWVKTGHTVGFVPVHPGDGAGKSPVNLKSGVFRLINKNGLSVERIEFDAGKPVKVLDEAPREFRKPSLELLKTADVPQAYAHSVYAKMPEDVSSRGAVNVASGLPKPGNMTRGVATADQRSAGVPISMAAKGFASAQQQGTPINFDRRSQSFSVVRPVVEGGRSTTAIQPLGGSGANFQPGVATSRTVQNGQSYTNNGSAGRTYTPSSTSNSGASYNSGATAVARPSTPNYSAPSYSAPAPSYSAPAPSYSAPASSPSSASSPVSGALRR